MKTIHSIVSVTVPDDRITPAQIRLYILEAVLSMRGSMAADEAIFQLPSDAFTVRPARR